MIVIFLLIPLSIVVAAAFLGAFIWAVHSGQYEDTCTPAMRLLFDERKIKQSLSPSDRENVATSPTSNRAATTDQARATPSSDFDSIHSQ